MNLFNMYWQPSGTTKLYNFKILKNIYISASETHTQTTISFVCRHQRGREKAYLNAGPVWVIIVLSSFRKSLAQYIHENMEEAPPLQSWNQNNSCFSSTGSGLTQLQPKIHHKLVCDLRTQIPHGHKIIVGDLHHTTIFDHTFTDKSKQISTASFWLLACPCIGCSTNFHHFALRSIHFSSLYTPFSLLFQA